MLWCVNLFDCRECHFDAGDSQLLLALVNEAGSGLAELDLASLPNRSVREAPIPWEGPKRKPCPGPVVSASLVEPCLVPI